MSTLSDDLADAERRAREAVTDAVAAWLRSPNDEAYAHKLGRADHLDRQLERYAAVCRLAGRWEADQAWALWEGVDPVGKEEAIRAELARLMADCQP